MPAAREIHKTIIIFSVERPNTVSFKCKRSADVAEVSCTVLTVKNFAKTPPFRASQFISLINGRSVVDR